MSIGIQTKIYIYFWMGIIRIFILRPNVYFLTLTRSITPIRMGGGGGLEDTNYSVKYGNFFFY